MQRFSIVSALKTSTAWFASLVIVTVISLTGCGSESSYSGGSSAGVSSIDDQAARESVDSAEQEEAEPTKQANSPPADKSTRRSDEATKRGDPTATAPDSQADASPSGKRISAEAFRMAAYDGRLDTVRQAVAAGAEIDAKDATQSLTALHMAAYNGHTETVKFLIDNGAEVDARDRNGMTPLIHASTGNFPETVQVLIDAGAEVNAKETTESFTALMFAAAEGQQKVLQVLLENGADKSIADDDQDKAIDHARDKGHTEIVEMLQ